jgi:hypothetical protein
MALHAYNKFEDAHAETQKGESLDKVSKALAKDSVAGLGDFALNMGGGIAGTEIGVRLATSDTILAAPGQAMQRAIMKGENWTLSKFSGPTAVETVAGATPKTLLPQDKITTLTGTDAPAGMVNRNVDAQLGDQTALAKALEPAAARTPYVEKTGLAARLEQHGIANLQLDRFLDKSGDGKSQMYFGSLHGHSNRSDGLGEPIDLFRKAAEEGQQITTLTEHNHLAARGGVSPSDPRAGDEANVPIIASAPIEYAQEFADAAATTTPTHVSLVGTEIGTIGKVGGGANSGGDGGGTGGSTGGGHGGHPGKGGGHHGVDDGGATDGTPTGATESLVGNLDPTADVHDHDLEHHTHGMMNPERVGATNPGGKPFDLDEARAESNSAAHIGGVNHIGLLEVPTFFETIRQPAKGVVASLMRAVKVEPAPVVKAPDVVKINDGDYRALVDHLDQLKATDGGSPIIELNHPRRAADLNPSTPEAMQGRDYGQKSFKNHQEWLDRFATPYVRQIELIKGGALNPNPVDTIPVGMIDPKSFAGYINDGVHASPSFGRDFHFGDPVGNPGATGIYAKALDKPSILDALRQRRTIATTSSAKLSGVLTGNDDIVMGSIMDHSVTPSLALKMRIDGVVDPAAKYSVKLWGDTNIGSGDLAKIVQEKDVLGSDLLAANQTVAFDTVNGTTGKNSAYYVEVNRVDPTSGNTDRMWTAPIWLENLAGTDHSLLTKLLNGQLAQSVPNPFQSKVGVTQ